jgi:uncharacterized protein
MDPAKFVKNTKSYLGLLRKAPIEEIYKRLLLPANAGPHLPGYGDDAAVIPFGGEYLLLAADGIMPRLLIREPYAAGKASVMVTVNDIYSMGGRPLAMVNVLASGDPAHRTQVVEGIQKGCEKLGVPMVGGHLHPDAPPDAPSLSVAILGHAKKLLRSHLAQPEDDLIFAADLQGRPGCTSVLSWDANSGKTTRELLDRLETMPLIAERELARAAKDVSNAGLLGTLAIMMENSGRGAMIDLEAIPFPQGLDLGDWLISFQSFGFVLSVPAHHSRAVLELFRERAIHAAVVGKATEERKVVLHAGAESRLLFDLEVEKITGITYRPLKTTEISKDQTGNP